MKTSLIPIGNSKGIIIPAPVIRKLGIQDKAENGDDELLIDSVFEDETFEEWEASSSMRSIG